MSFLIIVLGAIVFIAYAVISSFRIGYQMGRSMRDIQVVDRVFRPRLKQLLTPEQLTEHEILWKDFEASSHEDVDYPLSALVRWLIPHSH